MPLWRLPSEYWEVKRCRLLPQTPPRRKHRCHSKGIILWRKVKNGRDNYNAMDNGQRQAGFRNVKATISGGDQHAGATIVTIHDIEQGSDEWKELRAGRYTGTSAHKLLKFGVSAYSLTQKDNFNGTFWTKRGNILEEEAIELYERITHTKIERPGFITNDRFPDCGYSPDGLQEKTLLEVKCFTESRHLMLSAGDIPLEIQAQIHFGMLICERRTAQLILYNPKLEPTKAFKIIKIPARPNVEANFKKILTRKEIAK